MLNCNWMHVRSRGGLGSPYFGIESESIWTAAPSLRTHRYWHSCWPLCDGLVVESGGRGGELEVRGGSWRRINSCPCRAVSRSHRVAASISLSTQSEAFSGFFQASPGTSKCVCLSACVCVCTSLCCRLSPRVSPAPPPKSIARAWHREGHPSIRICPRYVRFRSSGESRKWGPCL